MNFVNLTPHAIVLNNGTTFPPSGDVARVTVAYSDFDSDGIATTTFGNIIGLPDPAPDTFYIVSGMVAATIGKSRADVVTPATGHPMAVRQDGQIISVPGFVRG